MKHACSAIAASALLCITAIFPGEAFSESITLTDFPASGLAIFQPSPGFY
jgi:hypothetical protein